MTTVQNIISELNIENGTKHKLAVLKKHSDNDLFARVLKMTYDKVSFTYGLSVKHWHDLTHVEALHKCVEKNLGEALDFLSEALCGRSVTGHEAIDQTTKLLAQLSVEDRDLVLKIINRDLRINVGRTNINKVFSGLIVKPVYMRCDTFSKKAAKKINPIDSFVQLKADGTYRDFTVENGVVSSTSRSGEDYDYPLINAELSQRPDGHYIGELTVVRDGVVLPRAESNGLINSDEPPHEDIVLDAWDYVTLEEYNAAAADKKYRGKVSYDDRFEALCNHINGCERVRPIETHRVDSAKEAMVHVQRWMNAGLEGGVWKDADGKFFDGTSGQQQKMKLVISLECRLVGYLEGKKGTVRESTFGSVLFENDEGTIKGRCSGFSNDMLKKINDNREYYVGKVFTVECNDITKGRDNDYYALSHPRFIEFRDDKDTTDTLEEAMKQKQMAMDLEV